MLREVGILEPDATENEVSSLLVTNQNTLNVNTKMATASELVSSYS